MSDRGYLLVFHSPETTHTAERRRSELIIILVMDDTADNILYLYNLFCKDKKSVINIKTIDY